MSISTVWQQNRWDILHPDLRSLTKSQLYMRAEFPWKWFKSAEVRINWYGGAIRESGGNGMYMTEPQAAKWTNWVKSDVVLGPS